jgi:hypothetical protein
MSVCILVMLASTFWYLPQTSTDGTDGSNSSGITGITEATRENEHEPHTVEAAAHVSQVKLPETETNHVAKDVTTRAMSMQQNQQVDPLNMCFVTAEFSERVQDADILPVVQADMRTVPPRHFLFTNMEQLQVDGWDKIVLTDADFPDKYKRQITKSRWPKFMGWQHPRLQHCQIIFYGDAYMMNPVNETVWRNMAKQVRESDAGLMQGRQPGIGPRNGPIKELTKNARVGKDSFETANYTIAWLLNQTDYKQRTPVYKNAQFGYDPSNPRFRNFVTEFWGEYSKEMGSWRDQAYWAYFLSKHGMKPIGFPDNGHTSHGEGGKQGHNGHIYDLRSKAAEKR